MLGRSRHLPPGRDRQFVRMSAPIAVEDDWAVGIEHVSALPYYSADFGEFGNLVELRRRRGPRGGNHLPPDPERRGRAPEKQ